MLRSLHMKLVLIMILLVTSLMMVAGAFLINSVGRFYLNDFMNQMKDAFQEDPGFYSDLTDASAAEVEYEDKVSGLQQALDNKAAMLGIDGRNRNYFILNSRGTICLASSNSELEETMKHQFLESANVRKIVTLYEEMYENGDHINVVGDSNSLTAKFMDIAVTVVRGEEEFILYIFDNRQTVQELRGEMFVLIIEAMGFGLLISILLSFLLSKTMVIPIQRLTDSAKRMAEGDFSHDITVDSQDEIGVLTNTFNNMAGQLHETLQEVENERTKLDALFLHMTDGVVAFNRNGKVIHSNPAAEEMLARPILVGGTADYEELFGALCPLETILSVEHDCLKGDMVQGERRLQLVLAPFSREEQGGALVVIHDVTEQVKTEDMRREFVANVSHELRTPLTNIRSYAETLAETPDIPKDMQENFLQVILNESDRMTHIVQDLLTLSRFDSGKSGMSYSFFSLGEALQSLYDAVKMEAHRRNHQLELKIKEALPEIRADRERILQVLMNIISNSIKYTADGGHIVIEAGRMDRFVWIEVSDDGIGIPEEDRERIFDRFYRVDKARSRESGGTGLGLSIAKEIVNQHEGELLLVDRDGPGTTIRLELKMEGPEHDH